MGKSPSVTGATRTGIGPVAPPKPGRAIGPFAPPPAPPPRCWATGAPLWVALDAGHNHQHKPMITSRTIRLTSQRRELRGPDDCMNKSTIVRVGFSGG